ncbi:helix-turn-helix transcriptional regulator [Arenicella sp.]|nr:helix-turn-helix transcriptional regulator [Arenicella sp.]
MDQHRSPEDFQQELFSLIKRMLAIDGCRFNVYVPGINLNQEIASSSEVDKMVKDYNESHWNHDPLHPSKYEDKDTVVITNSMLMTDFSWQKTEIFKTFFKPHGYFHNCDVFFRQQDRIIAVLSLIRKDPARMFADQEVELLKKIQPFIQYSLSKVYLPKRVHDRKSLASKYKLTARELDVVELALTGASNKVLVKHLNISLPTLRTHMQNIYTKVGVHSSSELISTLMTILK